MQERQYQSNALAAIESHYEKKVYHQLVAMSTGTGKTIVFSKLPTKLKHVLPGQMLVLAHREELIDQAVSKMRSINPSLRIDKEKAEHRADPSLADVVVASVATLGRKGTKRLDHYNWDNFDKICVDEAHHSVADSYKNVYESAGILRPDDTRLLIGFTATPSRSDGKALAELYQKIVYSYGMRQAIEDGWLVDVRGVRVTTDTNLDNVSTVGGDFAQKMLGDAVDNPKRNQAVVKAWLDHGENRPTVGFTVTVAHAQNLAAMFRQYGVKAEAVWGEDPDRADKLSQHRDGSITILLNCGILVEGYDDWRIGCVLLARPTKSSVVFTQQVGRTTRLQDGTGNLLSWEGGPIKRDCIVIDVVDASTRHSLVTLPTLMGMSASLNLKGKSLVGAIKSLEAAQKEYAHIDFSALADIDSLASFVESVNLFEVKFPPEVEEHSKLSWHAAADGGFILLLPGKDQVKVQENLLNKWSISGSIHGNKYKGERDTIEEAFKAADDLVMSKAGESINILKREAKWHSAPATPAQIRLLTKFYRGKQLPLDLDKGKASRLIGSFMAGKA